MDENLVKDLLGMIFVSPGEGGGGSDPITFDAKHWNNKL